METKNPPPTMTEKTPTTTPPTKSSAVVHVSSQGGNALVHERSITVLHPAATTVCTAFPFSLLPLLWNCAGSPRRLERLIVNQKFAPSSRASCLPRPLVD